MTTQQLPRRRLGLQLGSVAIDPQLISPVAMVGGLCLAIVCAYLLSTGRTTWAYLFLGAAIVVPASLAMLREIGLGVALLPLMACAIPITVGTGTQSPLVFALIYTVIVFGLWIVRSVLENRLSILSSTVNLPLVVLMLVWVLSYLYNDATHSALAYDWDRNPMPRVGQLAVVLISGIVMLLGVNFGREIRWIRLATWAFIAFSVVPLLGFFANIDVVNASVQTRGFYTMWVVALAYGQLLFNKDLSRWARLGLFGLVAAWLFKAVILQVTWFSGWIPTVVAVIVITLLRSRRACLGLVVALALVAFLFPQQTSDIISGLYQYKVDQGDLTRLGIWAQAWDLYSQRPVLGSGPAGYAVYYQTIYRGSQFSLSTHSGYMDIMLETGLAGAVAAAWFAVSLVVVAWRACRRWRSGFLGSFARAASGGIAGVLVGIALGDWLIPFVYNQTIAGFRDSVHTWLFLGFLAALAALPALPGSAGGSERHGDQWTSP